MEDLRTEVARRQQLEGTGQHADKHGEAVHGCVLAIASCPQFNSVGEWLTLSLLTIANATASCPVLAGQLWVCLWYVVVLQELRTNAMPSGLHA